MLERFFEKTSEDADPRRDQRGWKSGSAAAGRSRRRLAPAVDPQGLEDNLETCRARLANFQKARETASWSRPRSSAWRTRSARSRELAINRQEPEFISGQVDQVAGSLVQTEQTMNELQFATGFGPIEDATPSIIPRGTALELTAPPAADEPPRPRRKQTEDGIRYY